MSPPETDEGRPGGGGLLAELDTDHDTADRRRSPDDVLADPNFREWQAAWRRRIAFSRRMAPLDDGVTDPVAPAGRWP